MALWTRTCPSGRLRKLANVGQAIALSTGVGRAIPIASSAQVRRLTVLAAAVYRTTVLASLDDADFPLDSYQLFERCAES
jgi:hypothetical protein